MAVGMREPHLLIKTWMNLRGTMLNENDHFWKKCVISV